MNKVLLDNFSTQISDQRGSKKLKKIIFSPTNFLVKKDFFLSQIFFVHPLSLSKLIQVGSFTLRCLILTFNFEFMSGGNIRVLKKIKLFINFKFQLVLHNPLRIKDVLRDVNFFELNFQK
jgi:hypothetical protein